MEIDYRNIIPPEQAISLVMAPLAVQLDYAQIAIPDLCEFSQKDIDHSWKTYLTNPDAIPEVDEMPLPINVDYDIEEDYILYTHIINEEESLEEFMKRASGIIKPCRTRASIEERINYIKSQNTNFLIEKYTEKIMLEKLFFLSATGDGQKIKEVEQYRLKPSDFNQCRCSLEDKPEIQITEAANERIDKLGGETLKLITEIKFHSGELAMLRGENVQYFIKEAGVLLGRNTESSSVDIDISYGADPFCNHISRKQAIISFLPDFNFYIENIGARGFRVNGVVIPPTGMCMLTSGAMLDFSDNLFIFIPNTSLIEYLKSSASTR